VLIMKKKDLAMLLSKFKLFDKPSSSLEQYYTDPELAADALWFIHMHDGFNGKLVADLGCGNGVLGLGALALGAGKVFFVDSDKDVISLARHNLKVLEKIFKKKFKAKFINKDVGFFSDKVDMVVQNPPFGVQKPHADRLFLFKAMGVSPLIYSFHKLESDSFISKFSSDNRFIARRCLVFDFLIRMTMPFHRKRFYKFKVGFWRISLA
ncbi:MAG: methyltransferase, partial [archaeon]